MKKSIGFIALFVGIIDLFMFMFLMLSDNIISDGGFTTIGAFCFVLWFVCVFTVIFCLAGSFFQFLGKTFGSGFYTQTTVQNGNTVYCPQCGKAHNGANVYCPHCGAKQ